MHRRVADGSTGSSGRKEEKKDAVMVLHDSSFTSPLPATAQPAASQSLSKEEDRFWNVILGLLLVLVSFMLYNEIVRHYHHRQQVFWDDHYLAAVRSDANDWKFGWRLEDLEQRILSQRAVLHGQQQLLDDQLGAGGGTFGNVLSSIRHPQHPHSSSGRRGGMGKVGESTSFLRPQHGTLEGARELRDVADGVFRYVENSTALYTVSCRGRSGALLRVGPDDFRDVPTDRCQVFSTQFPNSHRTAAPHAIWQLVDLGEGTVGFRSLANGKYLKVVPPSGGDTWSASWKVEVVSPLPGLAERFKLESGGLIKSELMHGYLQCTGDKLAEAVKGYPGDSLYEESDAYRFNLTQVGSTQQRLARQLREASQYIEAVQGKQLGQRLSLLKSSSQLTNQLSTQVDKLEKGFHIALVVPMTSRGTDMSAVEQSPFWFNLFASFMESVDWSKNKHTFTFYLGFDRGDPLYDTGDAWSEMRAAFSKNTRRALTWLNYETNTSHTNVLEGQLNLKLKHFEDTVGAPSQAVVGLINQAYDDGCDYFFQVNDDTVIVSKDWATSFTTALFSNPIYPNLGITGPVDTNNDRILTHAFAHRTHIDIFGRFFPKAFKNWWSDDWISTVYGSLHTFRMYEVLVTHNVQSQKTGAFNRYAVDDAAQYRLRSELQKGFVTINRWLKEKGLSTLPLPSICGYSPLIEDLYPLMVKDKLKLR